MNTFFLSPKMILWGPINISSVLTLKLPSRCLQYLSSQMISIIKLYNLLRHDNQRSYLKIALILHEPFKNKSFSLTSKPNFDNSNPITEKITNTEKFALSANWLQINVCSQPIIVDSSPCHELLSWALFFVMKVATHIFLQEAKIAWSWLPATLKIQSGFGNDLMAPFRSVNPISDGLSNTEFT